MKKTFINFAIYGQVIAILLLVVLFACTNEKTSTTIDQKISQLHNMVLPLETNDIDGYIDGIIEDKGVIAGWAAIKKRDSVNSTIYCVLHSEAKTYILDTFKVKRPDVTQAWKINRDDSGYEVIVPRTKIEKGKYKIGVLIKKDNMTSFQFMSGKIFVN